MSGHAVDAVRVELVNQALFLAHGVDRIRDGRMQRAMFLAKGSLFLGRMTQGSDGLSVVLERNPGA